MKCAHPWSWAILAAGLMLGGVADAQPVILVPIDARAAGRPFPHFWEQMFGSGRAVLALRAEYRRDLGLVKGVTDFRYLRFRMAFSTMTSGMYEGEVHGKPLYNFTSVDEIYDGLLAAGVPPLRRAPASCPGGSRQGPRPIRFWYHPNVAPPKDYRRWGMRSSGRLSRISSGATARPRCANGIFEVWNEPNLDFWTGVPKQTTYWQLYDHTARAVKSVDSRLTVGGPATAQTAWVSAFHAASCGPRSRAGRLRLDPRVRR